MSLEKINKKYDLIYADPPWTYKDKSKSHGGGAENHYRCMSIKIEYTPDKTCNQRI